MTAGQPNADPSPPTIEDGFQMVRQRVIDVVNTMEPGDPAQSNITGLDLQVVVRTASRGVLDLLGAEGMPKASGILKEKLEAAAETDDTADLAFTIGGDYRRRAEVKRERDETADTKTAQARMALLAEAAGGTAVAIVASVLRPDSAEPLFTTGEDAVRAYAGVRHNAPAAVQLMRGLIDQAEASVRPKPESA